jgi:hypothetical protein
VALHLLGCEELDRPRAIPLEAGAWAASAMGLGHVGSSYSRAGIAGNAIAATRRGGRGSTRAPVSGEGVAPHRGVAHAGASPRRRVRGLGLGLRWKGDRPLSGRRKVLGSNRSLCARETGWRELGERCAVVGAELCGPRGARVSISRLSVCGSFRRSFDHPRAGCGRSLTSAPARERERSNWRRSGLVPSMAVRKLAGKPRYRCTGACR